MIIGARRGRRRRLPDVPVRPAARGGSKDAWKCPGANPDRTSVEPAGERCQAPRSHLHHRSGLTYVPALTRPRSRRLSTLCGHGCGSGVARRTAPVAADGTEVWNKTAGVLAQQVSETVWSSTFQHVQGTRFVDDVLVLTVPSQMVRQRIEQRYLGLIEGALHDAGFPDVSFVIEVEIDDDRTDPVSDLAARVRPSSSAASTDGLRSEGR